MIILTESGEIVNLDNIEIVRVRPWGDRDLVEAIPSITIEGTHVLGKTDDKAHAERIIDWIFSEWPEWGSGVKGIEFKKIARSCRESLAKDRQRVKFMADDLDDETLKDLLHEEFVEVAESVIAGWSELKRAQARQWGQAEYGKDFDATIEVPEMPKFLEEYAT